ncbi:unnamed protein product (mitochondrion) [Plasmodiophora brassicae]|uniref:Protein kinase domain-containing protein n=1 Tax=Plasmodiophora brassicae TaxID=37360 RepID=A0A3P3YEU4_PLABS|nr:unnamed protein product [Plasmodiophora brassicae]
MLCSMWQGATAALVIVFGVCVGIIHGTSYEKRPFEHDGLVEVASKRRALDVGPGYEAATMDAGAHYVANDTVGIAKKVAHNDGSMQQNQRYKILSKIGAGTYGKVFVAKDMTSRHNHIVAKSARLPIHRPNDRRYRIRSQGRISENDSRQYLDDIICGVDACHKLNIIVNDMKPENMAFDEEDNLKLIDFGMACSCADPVNCDLGRGNCGLRTAKRCVALLLITVVVYAEAVRGTEINKSPLDYEPMAKAGSKRRAVSDSMPKIPKLRRLVAFMSSPKTSRLHQPDTGNVTGDIDVGSGVDRNSVAKDARNPSRLVAIKRQNMSTPMRQHVALNEIRMLERLRDCPAIVQIGTLVHRIMRQGRISERNTKRYLDDIISGVYACHMRGIILNDIKPANMAFDEDDNLKLIDFGLATYCPSRMMRVSTSTPNYASPEQFKLEDNQVKAQEFDGFVADAWAVGITLVQMLTGELLFPGRNADEVRRNILNCRMNGLCLEQWQRLSQGAKLLSQRILQRDTSRRLGIQGIGNDDWFQSDSDTEH